MALKVPEWTLADRLRKAREAAGLDRDELSERTGLSRNTLSNYELGKTTPRRSSLKLWAMATEVPVDWLLTGADMTKAPAAVATEASSVCAPWDLNPEPADVSPERETTWVPRPRRWLHSVTADVLEPHVSHATDTLLTDGHPSISTRGVATPMGA